MSCKKAIVIAEKMKAKFGEKINLNVYTIDSEEAKNYEFRSSTNVLLDEELLLLDTVLDEKKMEALLSEKLS